MLRTTYVVCPTLALLTLLVFTATVQAQQTTRRPENPLYASVPDDVYLQESPQRITTESPVSAVVVVNKTPYAVVAGQLNTIADGKLQPVANSPSDIARLFAFNDQLWATTDKAVYRFDNNNASKVFDQPMVDLCLHLGTLHGATETDIYRFADGKFVNAKPDTGWLTTNTTMIMEDGTQILADPIEIKPVRRIVSYNDTLYLLRPHGPALLEGPVFSHEHVEWGRMPAGDFRDMLALGSRIYITSSRGVAVLSGTALTQLTGDDGLPYEDTTCLAQGFDRDLWIGTTTGAIRKVGDDYHYFGANHWLPGNNVHDIAVAENKVYVATDKGLGIIHYQPYTLQKKADYFENIVNNPGATNASALYISFIGTAKTKEWHREISDNDGGHTAHYLAAMCFKYAVTGDESARTQAVDAFQAMRWLQTVTGTDGFFAPSNLVGQGRQR